MIAIYNMSQQREFKQQVWVKITYRTRQRLENINILNKTHKKISHQNNFTWSSYITISRFTFF